MYANRQTNCNWKAELGTKKQPDGGQQRERTPDQKLNTSRLETQHFLILPSTPNPRHHP